MVDHEIMADTLRRANSDTTEMTRIGPRCGWCVHCGTVDYQMPDGTVIAVFFDGGAYDYIDEIRWPDGTVTDFEDVEAAIVAALPGEDLEPDMDAWGDNQCSYGDWRCHD